jgi:hypothetical protein
MSSRNTERELRQISQSAYRIQNFIILEPFSQRDDIKRLALIGKSVNRTENVLMVSTVEIMTMQTLYDLHPSLVIEHQPAEDRLFRFDRVRRDLERLGRRIAIHAGDGRFIYRHDASDADERPPKPPSST